MEREARRDTTDTIRQIAVWVAMVVTIIVNGLAGSSATLNGQVTGDVANRYGPASLRPPQVNPDLVNLWLPAGYVFSIWGLIYIGLIAYAVFQSLPSQRTNPRLRAIGWPFVVSCVANILWLFFFQYSSNPDPAVSPNTALLILSVIAMLVLLAALVWIYLALRAGNPSISRAEKWAVRLPFSIYLGWITVATVANISHVLVASGWTGQPLSAIVWLIVMFVVAVGLAGLMAITRRDVAYLLVLVWAFVGIAVNYSVMTAVLISAALAALVVLGLAVLVAARGAWQGKAYAA